MSSSAELPAPGDVVAGRYRVDEQLGRGGMGAVFRATQLGLMRAVALKVLLPERTGSKVRERFEREARVAAAMRHDGVIDVYDFGVDDDGRMFIVMELLIGESLRTRLERVGTLSIDEATAVLLQVGAALSAAHDVGLVHRDIKPDNIFCVDRADGHRFKVVDFGLAFIKDGGDLGRLTSDTAISGPPDYMAPEQCRGGADVGPAADMYALGCVAMEMLSGQPPFSGQQGELLAQQLHVPAPRLSARRADAPPELSLLIERLLDKKPEARPTAKDLRVSLEEHEVLAIAAEARVLDRRGRALAPNVGVAAAAAADTTDVATTDIIVERPRVMLRGEVPAGMSIALAVNGFDVAERDVVDTDEAAEGVELLLSATPSQVERRVKAGAVVIATADPDDLDAFSAYVRAGAAEVAPRPASLEDIASRTVRAQRRAERKRPRS